MNLAFFGGSFDPPHRGHKAIIDALEELDFIDKIIVMPTFLNPLKKAPLFSPSARLEMLEDIIKDSAKAQISRFELDKNEVNFTIDSIKFCKKEFGAKEIFIVIGADILAELDRWREIEKLKKMARFIVATRANIEIPSEFLKINVDCADKSCEIRQKALNGEMISESALLQGTKKYITRIQMGNEMCGKIISLLEDKKAQDVEIFDLRGCNYITEFVIIATSLAEKHSFALLDMLKTELKQNGAIFYATDEESGDWIIADLGEIMVHIFTENHRRKFNLEEFLRNFEMEREN